MGRRRRRPARAVVLALAVATAVAVVDVPGSAVPAAGRQAAEGPRILLLGDSVLDQLGPPAAGTLRRLGAAVVVDGVWGSRLLTREQYDFGQSIPDGPGGSWFRRADAEVAAFRPTLVGVSLNHNYFEPWPRDANGVEISDTGSAAFATMVSQQIRLFVEHLGRDGATVVLIAPPPHDPAAPLPIWDVYRTVAAADGIPIVDAGTVFGGGGGGRYSDVRRDCGGALQAIHSDGLHLSPWASSVMGTALGRDLAAAVGLAVDPADPVLDPCAPPADGWSTTPGSFKTSGRG
jgi:hypothetical protein